MLEYLLDKTAYGDGDEICGHIRSLKVCHSHRQLYHKVSHEDIGC